MKQELTKGLQALDISATEGQVAKLLAFVELLKKWNKVYNLTALKSDNDILRLHLLDSLTVKPYVESARRVLDVGSGAGLPGVPLAIVLPHVQFVLLDSNGKKTRFMQQAIISLGLSNCEVVHQRIEQYQPTEKFDTIVTRAFAEIGETLARLQHFSTDNLRLLFMKGKSVQGEIEKIDKTYAVQSFTLSVPGLDADRSLVIVTKTK